MRLMAFLAAFTLSFVLFHYIPDFTTAILANVVLFIYSVLQYALGGKSMLKIINEELKALNKGEESK